MIRIGFWGQLYYTYNKELPTIVLLIVKAPKVPPNPKPPKPAKHSFRSRVSRSLDCCVRLVRCSAFSDGFVLCDSRELEAPHCQTVNLKPWTLNPELVLSGFRA